MIPCFFDVTDRDYIYSHHSEFPFCLGPYALQELDTTKCIITWEPGCMKIEELLECKLMDAYNRHTQNEPLTCRLSESAELTLGEEDRKKVKIPAKAHRFAWSYPVEIEWE